MTEDKPEDLKKFREKTVQRGIDFLGSNTREIRFHFHDKFMLEEDNDAAEDLLNAMDPNMQHSGASISQALEELFLKLKDISYTKTETMEDDKKIVSLKRVLN